MKRLIPFLLILLFLVGCAARINIKHVENVVGKEPEARKICTNHGQNFAAITTLDMKNYKVVCVQPNPYKTIEYELS